MIVTFTGDISITGSFIEPILSDIEILPKIILSEFKNSDFVVGNLEGATTNSKKTISSNTNLKSPRKTIKYLRQRNVSVFNLANNHILDYDEIGLKNTLFEIKNEHCSSFGAAMNKEKISTPLILNKEGVSIALFGITKCKPTAINNAQLFSSDDFSTLKKEIRNYRDQVNFIIVNFHGGEEYSIYPSPIKRIFLKKIATLEGVDCVIAHHSHTLQGYEKHNNTFIFYSLGNFIFDIPNHKPYKETNNSAVLTLRFTKNNFEFSFLPFKIEKGKITATNKIVFEEKIKKLCDFSNYKNNWQKEAFRILFRKENPKLIEALKDKNSLQNKKFLAVLTSKKFYVKIYTILKDTYAFSLYLNAILYKVKKKFTL